MACCVAPQALTSAARSQHPRSSRATAASTTTTAAAAKPRGAAASSRRVLTMASAASSEGTGGKVRREVLDRPARGKINTVDDYNFYSSPRIVNHVDDKFVAQLTELYRQRVPEGGKVCAGDTPLHQNS